MAWCSQAWTHIWQSMQKSFSMVALRGTAWAKMMRMHFRGLSPRFQRLGTITGHTVVQVPHPTHLLIFT